MNPALPPTSTTAHLNATYHDETPRDSSDEVRTYDGVEDVEGLVTSASSYTTPIIKHLPAPVKRVSNAAIAWTKGPDPPRQWNISPVFPRIQAIPLDLLDRWCPKQIHKVWLLIAFYLFWLLTFSIFLEKSAVAQDLPGYGAPNVLWCGSSLWYVIECLAQNAY